MNIVIPLINKRQELFLGTYCSNAGIVILSQMLVNFNDCVSILCQSTVSYVTNDMYTLLLQTLNEHYKTAEISGEKIDISFLKSSITLLIPDEGVLVKGWKITCFTSKTVNKSLKVKVN